MLLTSLLPVSVFQAGHVCGDSMDLVNGRPTGSLRISLGYTSVLSDIRAFWQFLCDCFIQGNPNLINALSRTKFQLDNPDPAHDTVAVQGKNQCNMDLSSNIGIADSKSCVSHTRDSNRTVEFQKSSDGSITNVIRDAGADAIVSNDVEDSGNSKLQDKMVLLKGRKAISSEGNRPVPHLEKIFVYPVKSCGAFEVSFFFFW